MIEYRKSTDVDDMELDFDDEDELNFDISLDEDDSFFAPLKGSDFAAGMAKAAKFYNDQAAAVAEDEPNAEASDTPAIAPELDDLEDTAERDARFKADKDADPIYITSDSVLTDEFVERVLAGRALYVTEWRDGWALYDDATGLWKRVDASAIAKKARDFLNVRYAELSSAGHKTTKIAALLGERKVNAIVRLAAGSCLASSTEFDSNPDVLLAGNGVVELKTGKLRQPTPDDRFTKRTPVAYRPDDKVDGSLLRKLLEALPEDRRKYLWAAAGQALTGYQPHESVVFFLNGEGSNGKSSIKALLTRAFGDYCASPSPTTLLKSAGNSDHSLMVFKGLRMAAFEELPESRYLDAFVIKRLAGTPVMRASQKFQVEEEFEIQATVFVSTNHLPTVSETENGTWRRLKVIDFPYTYKTNPVKEKERPADSALDPVRIMKLPVTDSLLESALIWLVQGAMSWYRNGQSLPSAPAEVDSASAKWRSENDRLEDWANNNLEEASEDTYVLMDDLYDSYAKYNRSSGSGVLSKQSLMSAIRKHRWFADQGYVVEERKRTGKMKQNYWTDPDKKWRDDYSPREARERATLVRGLKFL